MAESLEQYMRGKKCKPFDGKPHYFPDGDYLTYFFANEPYYEERVDEVLTVFRSIDTNELVGCKVKGVRHTLKTAGAFGVFVISSTSKTVALNFLFFPGAAKAHEKAHESIYNELLEKTKDTVVDSDLILAA